MDKNFNYSKNKLIFELWQLARDNNKSPKGFELDALKALCFHWPIFMIECPSFRFSFFLRGVLLRSGGYFLEPQRSEGDGQLACLPLPPAVTLSLKNFRIMERKQSSGFRRIFIVAFLLFLAPAGQSLTFT